jgi:hypothetical protein
MGSTFKARGDDALMFSVNDMSVLVRYYPEIESYQVQKKNALTKTVETNISASEASLGEVFKG